MNRERLGTEVVPVPLTGRRTRLRPATPADIDALYRLAIDPEVWHRWYQRDAIPSYTQFVAQMELESTRGLVVEAIETSALAGWVSHYRDDSISRYTYADVAVFPQYFRTGVGIEAFVLWMNFLFERRNLRKLYIEALEFTVHAYGNAMERYFHEEARLREHEYFSGRYWDHYTFAIYRHDFVAHVQPKLYARLDGQPGFRRAPATATQAAVERAQDSIVACRARDLQRSEATLESSTTSPRNAS